MNFYARSFLAFSVFQLCFFSAWCQHKDSVAHKKLVVTDIILAGNRVTRPSIIFRELTFKKGDTITDQWAYIAERSRENLMNTSLFNLVKIDTVRLANGELDAMVQLQERWYLIPVPILQIEERNFNTWWEQDHHRLDKTDYGGYLEYRNMFGLRQVLKARAQFGYTKQFGASYTIPYISKKQAGGLQFLFNYSQNHEMPYTSINNVLTYLNTPTVFLKKEYVASVDYTYRQGLYNTHIFEVDFFSTQVADTILKLNNNYLPFGQKQATFFETKYFFKRDMRDYAPYPLTGYYVDLSLNDYGMGMPIAGKSFNLFYAQASFRKYWSLGANFFYSAMAEGKVSQEGNQPYYLQRGLGYGNEAIRGYELYVMDGNNYALVKNEIKFRILNVPIRTIPLLAAGQFNTLYYSLFLTAFSDWGYVGQPNPNAINNTLAATPLWGNGFGLDFVTYYDLVFRLEYSFNQLGQSGFFLHFVAPM